MILSALVRPILLAASLFASSLFAVPLGTAAAASRRWNANGHMTSAAIAWAHMTPKARARAVALLKGAPALAELAELEPAEGTPAERERELFLMAATWADRIRSTSVPSHVYNRASWHFTDFYWRQVDGKVEAVPELTPGTENAIERLKLFESEVATAPADTTRSIALAWILHLAGDVHQPLHLSSRVTPEEPKGDKGGNSFRLAGQPNNLHSLWDGALDMADGATSGTQVARVDRLAAAAESALPFASVPAARLNAPFDTWGKESLDLAQHELYPPALHAGEVPSPEYHQRAMKIAEERVALAGYRLATLLNRVLGG